MSLQLSGGRLIERPGEAATAAIIPGNRTGVNIECNDRQILFITDHKLTSKGFQQAIRNYYLYCSRLLEDFHPEDKARDSVEKALRHLAANRVVNKVTSKLSNGI